MNLGLICPICNKSLKRASAKHTHGLSFVDWHALRIETQTGRKIDELLHDLYCVQRLGTPAICKKLHVTFRVLRVLFREHSIEMRSIRAGVQASWTNDDGTRRAKHRQWAQEMLNVR